MSSAVAVLLPLTEDALLAVQRKASQKHRITVSDLKMPFKELVEEQCPAPKGALIAIDPVRMRGEPGLSFGSSRSNDIVIRGPGITHRQFLISIDAATRSLTVKNISSDKVDIVANTTTKGTDMFVHTGCSLRAIAPGDTATVEQRMHLVAGEKPSYALRFKVLLHPGPLDARSTGRIDDFVDSAPEAPDAAAEASGGAAEPGLGAKGGGSLWERFFG